MCLCVCVFRKTFDLRALADDLLIYLFFVCWFFFLLLDLLILSSSYHKMSLNQRNGSFVFFFLFKFMFIREKSTQKNWKDCLTTDIAFMLYNLFGFGFVLLCVLFCFNFETANNNNLYISIYVWCSMISNNAHMCGSLKKEKFIILFNHFVWTIYSSGRWCD